MAALRGDISFRYIKQFFLVYFIILICLVDSTANAMPSIIGQSSQPGLFGQKSEGGLSTDSRKPGGLFGSSETSVSTTDVKGGVFGGGASGGLSFTSVAKQTESPGEGIFGGGGFSFSQLAMQAESSTSPGFKVKGKLITCIQQSLLVRARVAQ